MRVGVQKPIQFPRRFPDLDTEQVVDAVRRAVGTDTSVLAAFLFGSHAAGKARGDSDIDVAILLAEPSAPTSRKATLWRLIQALGCELPAERVDLVLLNDAPPKLAFHVLKHGRVATVRDAVALHRLRVRTYSLHADYEPIERFFRKITKQRAGAS
jgi:uncharacterized protein